ncbi:MAG: oligosaccharide repeat unit polymerase [Oscillospiraceae bacterium]|nr:oligosaccharide repeat unit polymerase [Oscillospiraceae bacterium]
MQSYIQCSVDEGTWEILAGAVQVDSGSIAMFTYEDAVEYQRIGSTLSHLAGHTVPSASSSYLNAQYSAPGGDPKADLVLTFPGNVSDGLARTSATQMDVQRTNLVRNQLIHSLNEAFALVMGSNGVYTPSDGSITTYQSDMRTFLNLIDGSSSSSYNGSSISFYNANTAAFTSELSNRDFPDAVTWYTDYVRIEKNGSTHYFLYRIPKGYRSLPSDGRPVTNAAETLGLNASQGDDAVFVHWGHLAAEAFINYSIPDEALRVTPNETYDSDPSALTEQLTNFFNTLANALANIFGFWSLDELIFNSGSRGSTIYAEGVFPSGWQPIIWAFFFVAEIAAFIMVLYALLMNVGKKLYATVNPVIRASAMEQIQSLLICAVILGTLPLIYKILMNLSFSLTGVFSDLIGGSTAETIFGGLGANSGGIGQILVTFLYLGALAYFNVFYLVRSVLVAFLMVLGPIAVAMLGMSSQKRSLTMVWVQEFMAQLFVQPMQAAILSFILLLPHSSGRKIEALVMVYALIPITNAVKKVILPSGAEALEQISQRGVSAAQRTALFAGGTALGAVAGGINAAKSIGRERQQPEQKNEEVSSGSQSTAANQNSASSNGTAGASANPTSAPISGIGKTGSNVNTEDDSNGILKSKTSIDAGINKESDYGSTQVSASLVSKRKNVSVGKDMISTLGTVALGTLGGGLDAFNKRAFMHHTGGGGGVVTQLSQKAGRSMGTRIANANKEPISGEETSPEQNASVWFDDFKGEAFGNEKLDRQAYTRAMESETGDNPYQNGHATSTDLGDGRYEHMMGSDNMKHGGVNGISADPGGDKGKCVVHYGLASSSLADRARLSNLVTLWKHGSETMRDSLRKSGIENITISKRKGDPEQVNVTFDKKQAAENYNLDLAKKGRISSVSDAEEIARFTPDVSRFNEEYSAPPTEASGVSQVSTPMMTNAPTPEGDPMIEMAMNDPVYDPASSDASAIFTAATQTPTSLSNTQTKEKAKQSVSDISSSPSAVGHTMPAREVVGQMPAQSGETGAFTPVQNLASASTFAQTIHNASSVNDPVSASDMDSHLTGQHVEREKSKTTSK